jgi:predicted outer membrane repeat protein
VSATPGLAVETWYVDDDAPPDGDGVSWETAYRHLADALDLARATGGSIELHVAAGTYRPDRSAAAPLGSGDRLASFTLASGVRILGGFAGPAAPGERDPDVHVTVLSGDLAGDDGPGFLGNDENSHHVVVASGVDATALLDGLTITAGNADGAADAHCFGGASHGAPCEIAGDCPDGACVSLDSTGAGLLAVGGRPTVTGCRVVDNFALFQGAGMMLKAGSDLSITGCTFSGNRALDNGGALYLGDSRPIIAGCLFTGNSGGNYAGASCNRDHSDAQFIDCVFSGNIAAEASATGGGAIVNASSSPFFLRCSFDGNVSIAGNGGAVYNKRGFHDVLGPSRPLLLDCTFESNTAAVSGGGMYSIEESEATLMGCTFTSNAASTGGAIYDRGALTLEDCILHANSAESTGGAIYNREGTLSMLRGSVESNTATTAGGVYDAGEATLTLVEVTGNAAAIYGGGFYNQADHATLVGCTVDGNTGYAGAGAYAGGEGLDLVECLFTGNVAESSGGGVYVLIGAVAATGTTFTGNEAEQGGALLSGIDAVVTLEACTLAGNAATRGRGGAVHASATDIEISGCSFDANTATSTGAAVLIDGASAGVVEESVFRANRAGSYGGGLAVAGESVVDVRRCVFEANIADTGGAVYLNDSTVTITDCRMTGNIVPTWGGALYAAFCDFDLVNAAVDGNTATERGGAVYLFRSAPRLINCTVTDNFAGDGGGLYSQIAGDAVITSSIFWENHDVVSGTAEPAQITFLFDSAITVSHSLVMGWTGTFGGTGNIDADPRLIDRLGPDGDAGTGDEDLRLEPGSPCIDAGDTGAVPAGVVTDLGGAPRVVDDPGTADTGAGGPPVVDMGAHEWQPPPCPGDVDGSAAVDFGDLLLLLLAWGPCPGCPEDLTGDDAVAFDDLVALLFRWGPCP